MADCSGSVAGSLKRTLSEAELLSDDEDITTKPKRKKLQLNIENVHLPENITKKVTGLKTETSDATVSHYADSGYDQSIGNTPCSLTPLKSVQPSSSGYISDRSEVALFSPDGQQGQTKFGPLRNPQVFKEFLRKNFSLLKDEIDPSGIAGILYADGIITQQNAEAINEERSRREKCDLLIKAISKSTELNTIQSTVKVLKAFCTEGYKYLLEKFSPKDPAVVPDHPFLTSRDIKGIFYTYGRQLEDELSPVDIIDSLVDAEVLNLDEHQDIKGIPYKPKKVKYLLKYILRKEVATFWMFCKILDEHYPALADLLRQNGKNLTEPVPIVQTRKETVTVTAVRMTRDLSSDSDTDSDEETTVKFEFGDYGKEEEQMIVDDYERETNVDIQQKVMEVGHRISKMQFSSVRINLSSLCRQSQMYLIKKCQESPEFLEHWLKHLLSDTVIKELEKKGTDTVTFEIKITLPKSDDQLCCACKISKEWIVQHFTVLLKELINVEQIVGKFSAFEGFDDKIRAEFDYISHLDGMECTEKFLHLLLDLSDREVHLCLLERELRGRGQGSLIERLSGKHVQLTGSSISVKEIRGNFTLLLDEIEPRRFVDMLRTMRTSDDIIDRVTSTDPRKERCKVFLNYIIKEGASAVSRFIPELERHGKHHIIESLSPKQSNKHDELKIKEAVIVMHSAIIDEIEPRFLRQTFIARKLIKAKEFDAICKTPSRKARANQLLLYVLEQDTVALNCLIDAMQVAGYRQLVNMIKEDMEKYTECPRLFEVSMKDKKAVKFKGEYKISFKPGSMTESPLQVYLHKLVYQVEKEVNTKNDSVESLIPDTKLDMESIRKQRTQQWIRSLDFDTSRKRTHEESVLFAEGKSCKRSCKESDWVSEDGSLASMLQTPPTEPPTEPPEDDKFDRCSTSVSYPSVHSSRSVSPSRCSPFSGEDSPVRQTSSPVRQTSRKCSNRPIFMRNNSLSDESCRTLTSSSDESSKRQCLPCKPVEHWASHPSNLVDQCVSRPLNRVDCCFVCPSNCLNRCISCQSNLVDRCFRCPSNLVDHCVNRPHYCLNRCVSRQSKSKNPDSCTAVKSRDDLRSTEMAKFFTSFTNTRAVIPSLQGTVNFMYSLLQLSRK